MVNKDGIKQRRTRAQKRTGQKKSTNETDEELEKTNEGEGEENERWTGKSRRNEKLSPLF